MSVHLILFLAFGAVAVAGAVNLLVQHHPINAALSHATFLPRQTSVRKISDLREHVIGRERTHMRYCGTSPGLDDAAMRRKFSDPIKQIARR